jgi:spore germination protein GerM
MRKLTIAAVVVFVGCLAGYLVSSGGCGKPDEQATTNSGRVKISRPVTQGNEVVLKEENVETPKDADPVSAALTALFQTADDKSRPSAIPAGTKLLKVSVEDGIATVNVSDEFNALKNSGDSAESLAQNALRKALAQFPKVKKMLLKVNGKTFESEHTDWSEPIPVRDTDVANGAP